MNKYVISNIKFLNKDHQKYIYEYIKGTNHSSNSNGSFFKMSDLDDIQIEFIYNFMKKIENNHSNLEKQRSGIMDSLEKDLSSIDICETPFPLKTTPDTIIEKPVLPVKRTYVDMKEIEEKMKNFSKPPKYKTGSSYERISKIIKKGQKSTTLKSKINSKGSVGGIFNDSPTIYEEEIEMREEDLEDIEDPDDLREEDLEEEDIIDEEEEDIDDLEEEDLEEEDLEDPDKDIEDEDIEEIKTKMLKLLVSKGYSLSDDSQLKHESFIVV
jgi:hypothetical protein